MAKLIFAEVLGTAGSALVLYGVYQLAGWTGVCLLFGPLLILCSVGVAMEVREERGHGS